MHAHEALRSEIEGTELFTTRLPTATSLLVPLPDWRPTPLRLDPEPADHAGEARLAGK